MESDYKFEFLEKYFGGQQEVQKMIDECKSCGARLVFSHYSDYKNYIIQETARCLDCGQGNRKTIHVMN